MPKPKLTNPTKPEPQLDERVSKLEEALSKSTRLTIVASLVAAVLGSGGAIGALQFFFDQPLKEIQYQKSQLEVLQTSIDSSKQRHDQATESLNRLIAHTGAAGDSETVTKLRKLLVQQEADFQLFLMRSDQTMQRIAQASPRSEGWYMFYQDATRRAQESSERRQQLLEGLADGKP